MAAEIASASGSAPNSNGVAMHTNNAPAPATLSINSSWYSTASIIHPKHMSTPTRRSVIASALASVGLEAAAQTPAARTAKDAPISPKDNLRVTKLETFLVKPRWLFLKVHTNAGIVGLGEPITEGRALTCAQAVKEIEPYLVGKDPRRVAHHWQAIYRHAFYRGGPILTSALSGIDQALWDIKGKALGVPVYELLGGPTRDRVRVYAHA